MYRNPYRNLMKLTLLAALVGAVDLGCVSHPTAPVQVTDVPPGSFITAWQFPVGVKSVNKFFLEGNQIFAYDPKNRVASYDLKGGLKFNTQVAEPGDVVGPPMVQADRIIFPTNSTLELHAPNGVLVKSLPLEQPLRSPGVVVDQTVYIGADSDTGGRIAAIALDRKYNIYRWTVLTGIVHTRPALHENVIFAATEDGRVLALNTDRSPLWPVGPEMPDGIFHTDGKIMAALKADEGGIYVPSTDTKLYCLDPNTGHVRWEYYTGAPVTTSPVPTADTVYIYLPGKGLVAIDKKTPGRARAAKWTYADGTQLLSDDAKYAYVLTTGGAIVALDKATGKEQFKTVNTKIAKGLTHVDPKDSTIFALTTDNMLVAIKPVLKTGVVGQLAIAN